MKVDSKNIMELFTEIKCLLEGIPELIQMGDDGFENSIINTTEDIKKVINVFTIEFMTPVTKEVSKEPDFLKSHLILHEKSQEGGMTPYENVQLFKARFYLFLKRELAKIDLQPVKNLELHNFIMNDVVVGSKYYSYFSTDFDRPAYAIISLVADEIIAQRKKYPQMAMKFDVPSTASSAKLIDKL
jgi:hypothetical protein